MEKFTTAKNITELETSEEKELRKTDKKRKQEQGEKAQKKAERKAVEKANKKGEKILKLEKKTKGGRKNS